jgi:nonsense-mediated mRNA decay protein 3
LIIKHNAQAQVTNMMNKTEGLDFFFAKKSHARKFVDFLGNVVPLRTQETKKQIGHDAS